MRTPSLLSAVSHRHKHVSLAGSSHTCHQTYRLTLTPVDTAFSTHHSSGLFHRPLSRAQPAFTLPSRGHVQGSSITPVQGPPTLIFSHSHVPCLLVLSWSVDPSKRLAHLLTYTSGVC